MCEVFQEALRRVAIELAQRDVPFRHIQQAFSAVAMDMNDGAPIRDDLAPWADRCMEPILRHLKPAADDGPFMPESP